MGNGVKEKEAEGSSVVDTSSKKRKGYGMTKKNISRESSCWNLTLKGTPR